MAQLWQPGHELLFFDDQHRKASVHTATNRAAHFPGGKVRPLTTPNLGWSLGLLALFPCSRRRDHGCKRRAQSIDAVDEAIASLLKQQAVVRKSERVRVRSLKVGQRLTGIIRDIGNFGLFVDVGAQRDGLVPISLVSAGYIADIYEEYMPGQKVSVWVAEIKQNGELSLTMQPVRTRKSKGILKQDLSAFDSISPEEWLTGTLMRVTERGLFVEVPMPDMEGRVVGLVRMKETGRLELDELEVGRKVQVRVLHSENRSQLNLSMRPMAGSQMSDEFFQLISKDPWLRGVVKRTTSSGAFVLLQHPTSKNHANAFLPIDLMAREKIQDPAQVVEIGEEISVKLLPGKHVTTDGLLLVSMI